MKKRNLFLIMSNAGQATAWLVIKRNPKSFRAVRILNLDWSTKFKAWSLLQFYYGLGEVKFFRTLDGEIIGHNGVKWITEEELTQIKEFPR